MRNNSFAFDLRNNKKFLVENFFRLLQNFFVVEKSYRLEFIVH